MKITNVLFLVAAFLMVVSCGKPTAESETKRWNANQKTIAALGAKYKGYKAPLAQVQSEADKLWEAALNVSSEEAKAEAMRGANRALYGGWVSKLDRMGDRLETLKDKVSDSRQTEGATETDLASLNEAVSEAKITLSRVEGIIMSKSANTVAEAEGLVNDADKQIDAASKRLDRAVKNITDRQKEKKETAEKEKAEEKENSEPIKCAACGSMNEAGALKCSSCTAPIEKKK